MFPYNDPQTLLDLHHRHAAELAHRAAADRLAREAAPGRHRRRWSWHRRPARRAATA